MKKILFASTAAGALAIGGMASAQGISLFGDARLGLGYNINNNGSAAYDEVVDIGDPNDPTDDVVTGFETPDEMRVVSRVRFGVRMTGETTNGIAFGATIRADNAGGGQGGTIGQSAGSVFISGIYGTLTAGDTAGADEQHVGDLPGVGLTNLGDLNETIFFSNGGSFGPDDDFALAPGKRPTLRYDYDFGGIGLPGLGFSLSTDRRVKDAVVGASYTFDLGGGNSVGVGAGYADINRGDASDPFDSPFLADDIEQISAQIGGTFAGFGAKAIWTQSDAGRFGTLDSDDEFTQWGGGLTYELMGVGLQAWYFRIDDASGRLEGFDGEDAYMVGFTYDLGGGATLAGGIGETFGVRNDNDEVSDGATVADFGIRMSF